MSVPPTSARRTGDPATIVFAQCGENWIRGSEQCLLDLVGRLDRSRYRPVVLSDAPLLVQETERLGATSVLMPRWGQTFHPLASVPIRAEVRRLLREHDAALVHANMAWLVPVFLPAVRRMRIPLVVHLHMPATMRSDRRFSFLHQVSAAVGVAHHVVEPLLADGMRPDRVRVIHNAVDADRLLAGGDAAGLRASLGIPGEALLAVAIGSLIHRKGHDVTLRGLALARARGADVHLLLCGDGEAADTLRALAAELGVAEAVHFLGYRADVGAVARAADVCVTSAREEALSLNVLEAQWLGLPVVASDIPGHREGMAPGESGLLVPLEDAQALAARLCELAASPEWRRQLGDHGRRFATEHFRMERYIAEFDALYSDLLARPGRAHGWLRGSAWPAEYTAWLADALRRRVPFI